MFLLNAVLFILVGLQLPTILEEQEHSAAALAGLGLLVSAAVVGTRLLWTMLTPFVIRALDRRASQLARRTLALPPGRRLGRAARLRLAGRGAGAAARLPRARAADLAHAVRDLRHARGAGADAAAADPALGSTTTAGRAEELLARREATAAAIAHLERLGEEEWTRDDTVERMLGLYRFRDRRLRQRAGELVDGDEATTTSTSARIAYQQTVREVLDAQRRRVIELRDEGAISDDVLHALERELDLEDQRLEI